MFSYRQNYKINSIDKLTNDCDINSICFSWLNNNRVTLLLWKNFKLKIRHPWTSLLWMLLPCIFTTIMVLICIATDQQFEENQTKYPAYSINDKFSFLNLIDKQILYAPKTNETDRIMKIYKDNTVTTTITGFTNELDLVDYYLLNNTNKICCAIIFNMINDDVVDVKLRFPFIPTYFTNDYSISRLIELTWKTNKQWPRYEKSGPRSQKNNYGGPPDYFSNGFLYVQHELSRSLAYYYDSKTEDFYDLIQMYVQRYPYPPYPKTDFLLYLQIFFPLNFLFSFISISMELTKNIVSEKESRLKEVMKIMGLHDWMHWLSWFLYSFIWNSLFGLKITLILCIPFGGKTIFNYSNPIIVFFFIMSYVISIITFCFLMSSLPKISEKSDIAGTISTAVYILTFLPYYFVNFNYDEISFGWLLACCLLFNVNMSFGLMILSRWEINCIGIQWSNIWEQVSPNDPLTLGHIFVMFIVVSLIQLTLALYIDAVFPEKYGIAKKWYFFVLPSYWFKTSQLDEEKSTSSNGIHTINLSKSYDGGKTFAVKKLKLNLPSNKITVLLGHNGAGKTTLMSMLCGLITPTSGSVYFGGINLHRESERARQNLGICPQFDVLFDHLTVEEHFWFYCKLKNINNRLIEEEINSMIRKIDIQSKRYKLASTLSGGMRRKLSVGIALIGGSKFVLLDEATSGMDVSVRKFIWDLLINEKTNRTILFSTHFMEEADVLGDKIAIMQQGQLQCFGSPYQLRKDLQIDHLLKISVEPHANKQKIVDVINSYVDKAKILYSINNEITFSLPQNHSENFESLFFKIEQNNKDLGVINFGISISTIEEVFIKANKFSFDNIESDGEFSQDLIKTKCDSLEHSSEIEHLWQIFLSQFVKKINILFRKRILFVAHFILPSIILTIGILSAIGMIHNLVNSPPLHISLESFEKVYATSFFGNDSQSQLLGSIYQNVFDDIPNAIVNNVTIPNVETKAIDYLVDKLSISDVNNPKHLVSAIFAQNEDKINVTALFNNQAYHTSSISVALVDETLLRYSLNRNDFKFSIWNEPFPKKSSDKISAREFDSVFQTHIISCLQMSLCLLLSSFSLILVVEESSNFKFIQKISGLKMYQYWIGNFILDYIFYLLSSMILSFILYIFDVKAFTSLKHQGFTAMMFLLNGFTLLPFIYLMARLFKDQYTAYIQITLILFISGFSTFITVLLLRIAEFNLYHMSQFFDSIFTFVFPLYTVTMSIFSIYDNYVGHSVCFSKYTFANITIDIQEICHKNITGIPLQVLYCCKDLCTKNCFLYNEDYFSWEEPGIGKYIIGSIFLSIVLLSTLTILEGRFGKLVKKMIKLLCRRNNKPQMINDIQRMSTIRHENLDIDVLIEETHIMENYSDMLKTYAMVVKNVSKNYGKLAAVKNISFAVERAECFGMLGENGAGKTTTFKVITGANKLTSGDVWINKYNTKEHMNKVLKDIGYCPQFDGILNELTGRETLKIICRIRGIKEKLIDQQIRQLSELLQFTKYIDQVVSEYSGGIKRKLSFAISIVGNPLIIFLDEPTTGIDPISRRGLWNAIRLVRSSGSSLVLVSHSMEECETLCNRLVIMDNGKIHCIGSPMHLKQKFGIGFIVQIKLSTKFDSQQVSINQLRMISACKEIALKKFMEKNFPCQFESKYENFYTFHIVSNDIKLSTMFGKIEKAKKRLHIEYYSINQPSLEKLFLSPIFQKNKI